MFKTKFLLMYLFTVMFFMVSCVTLRPDVGEVLVDITARNLAYQMAKKDPDIIKPGKVMLNFIIESDDVDVIIELESQLWDYLIVKYQDNQMLLYDLKALRSLFIIEETQFNLTRFKQVAMGGYAGLVIAESEL